MGAHSPHVLRIPFAARALTCLRAVAYATARSGCSVSTEVAYSRWLTFENKKGMCAAFVPSGALLLPHSHIFGVHIPKLLVVASQPLPSGKIMQATFHDLLQNRWLFLFARKQTAALPEAFRSFVGLLV